MLVQNTLGASCQVELRRSLRVAATVVVRTRARARALRAPRGVRGPGGSSPRQSVNTADNYIVAQAAQVFRYPARGCLSSPPPYVVSFEGLERDRGTGLANTTYRLAACVQPTAPALRVR